MTRDLVEEFKRATGELPPEPRPRYCEPSCRLANGVAERIRGRRGWERVTCGRCGRWLGDRPITDAPTVKVTTEVDQ